MARETGLEPATSGVTGRTFLPSINMLAFGMDAGNPNNFNSAQFAIWKVDNLGTHKKGPPLDKATGLISINQTMRGQIALRKEYLHAFHILKPFKTQSEIRH
jgi:hypothetical protein